MKTSSAILLVFALLVLVGANLRLVELARANPVAFMPHFTVASPENTTYTTGSISVDITAEVSQRFYYNDSSFFYNGSPWISIHVDDVSLKVLAELQTYNESWLTFHGEMIVNNISDGQHKLAVDYFSATIAAYNNPVVYFIVETHAPIVTVLSPVNRTYENSSVPLIFDTDKSISNASYILDSQIEVAIGGNTTISGLSAGVHRLTVYAWDIAGEVGVSDQVTFTVEKQPEPEPFPWLLGIVVSLAVAVVVAVAAVIYLKKRRGVVKNV